MRVSMIIKIVGVAGAMEIYASGVRPIIVSARHDSGIRMQLQLQRHVAGAGQTE
jgi:hypothetical protein